jgi:ATP adenylyltransferase
VTQIGYYTERVKRMVGKVHFQRFTRYERGTYDLMGGEELSDAEREELLQLCRQRLDVFRMQRGEEVGCLLTQKPAASGTGAATARRSAARSKSGCSPVPRAAANAAAPAVAQQTPHQRALEVDHIVPKNQGGSDDLSNLQALCFRCNAGKRDTDTTDFCGLQASYARRQDSCVFCALEASGRVLLENELALCIADAYPVTPGRSLVIPRRHGSRNQIRWAGTVRWSSARPQEPAWPASDHGWPASSARNLR